jgi:aminoglycoside 2'-N-acetyltransferase I
MDVTGLCIAHTAQLPATELARIRAVVDRAFGSGFDDGDWDHALGGLHVVAVEGDEVVAHAAVVQRQFVVGGRPVRTGFVEAVAVDPAWRGRGYAARVLDGAERAIRAAYHFGALSAGGGVEGMYLARGWLAWRGATYALRPDGLTRTPEDDDSVYVLPVSARVPVDVTGELICDWRDGDVW